MDKKLIRKLTIRLTIATALIGFMIFNLQVNFGKNTTSDYNQSVLFEIMFNEAVAQSTCNGGTCEITSGCWDAGVRENWCISVPGSTPWYCPWCAPSESCEGGFCMPEPQEQ